MQILKISTAICLAAGVHGTPLAARGINEPSSPESPVAVRVIADADSVYEGNNKRDEVYRVGDPLEGRDSQKRSLHRRTGKGPTTTSKWRWNSNKSKSKPTPKPAPAPAPASEPVVKEVTTVTPVITSVAPIKTPAPIIEVNEVEEEEVSEKEDAVAHDPTTHDHDAGIPLDHDHSEETTPTSTTVSVASASAVAPGGFFGGGMFGVQAISSPSPTPETTDVEDESRVDNLQPSTFATVIRPVATPVSAPVADVEEVTDVEEKAEEAEEYLKPSPAQVASFVASGEAHKPYDELPQWYKDFLDHEARELANWLGEGNSPSGPNGQISTWGVTEPGSESISTAGGTMGDATGGTSFDMGGTDLSSPPKESVSTEPISTTGGSFGVMGGTDLSSPPKESVSTEPISTTGGSFGVMGGTDLSSPSSTNNLPGSSNLVSVGGFYKRRIAGGSLPRIALAL